VVILLRPRSATARQRTILPDKKDGWASGRPRRTGELVVEVLVQELLKGQLFDFREGVRSVRRSRVVQKVDMVVVGIEAEG